MYLGLCLYKLNDYPTAIISFNKALELDSTDYIIYLNYVFILLPYPEYREKAR